MKTIRVFPLFLVLLIGLCSLISCRRNAPVAPEPPVVEHPFGSILGKVVDKYAYPIWPIRNAAVVLISAQGNDSTTTDSLGLFSFGDVDPGSYVLLVVATTYEYSLRSVTASSDTLHILVELPLAYGHTAGLVLVGLTSEATPENAYHLMDSLGISIIYLNGFYFHSSLPPDSVDYIKSTLSAKSYLQAYNYLIEPGVIRFTTRFHNIDVSAMQDWAQTKEQLWLAGIPSNLVGGELSVPTGEETYWIIVLRQFSIIRWLTLGYWIPGGFFGSSAPP